MNQVNVNAEYELYQIITDFEHPLEIFREGIQNAFDANATQIYVKVDKYDRLGGRQIVIDMFNNGEGLSRDKLPNFFDVANSTKVDSNYLAIKGMHGYKGHGTKVFFNAQEIKICSKTKEGDYWAASMKDPVSQIETEHCLEYSDPMEPNDLDIELPKEWEQGFRVQIINPKVFSSIENQEQLDHRCLRDYCKWYTIIGTVETLNNEELEQKGIKFYLAGINRDAFAKKYNNNSVCDPVPNFATVNGVDYEVIPLGHYFPPKRDDDRTMADYVNSIGATGKPSYKFYSKQIYNSIVDAGALSFRLIIYLEGEETERRYDLMMSRQGRARENTEHTAGQRYGLWACKGGVPVEKVDDWIEGGKGVGAYTFMHAFIDCDEFKLTANRGSVKNTEIDKINKIRKAFNDVFSSSKVKNALEERRLWEELEKTNLSVKADKANLKDRYKNGKKRKKIILPDETVLFAPREIKTGYSEAETFGLLTQLMTKYPKLFTFSLLDYDTNVGIDFVVEDNMGYPKYIELKGELIKQINHPFSLIYKFICYDTKLSSGEELLDKEEIKMIFDITENSTFDSGDSTYNGKQFTFCKLNPTTPKASSIEVICLKRILKEVIGATIED